MNSTGQNFRALSTKQARVLEETKNAAEYLSAQLPSGNSLGDMIGACPGVPGEVRLIYFPEKRFKVKKKMTQWKKTTAEEDFTAQWHIEGLSPGTRYVAVLEVRKPDSQETTAILRGGFELSLIHI